MIACGDARELDEELSTIAHKLRNVLEPHALFLVLLIRGGVQIIARSTDDHIDVAEIAAKFGGGGHPRASAALVKNGDINQVRSKLLALLPEIVKPVVTVAELMSLGPQLLPADTPAEVALQRMQRFGYEGYPVVEGKKLVGLLTRRAVDRAVSHKLNLPARSLMQAGSVTVQPTDSVEHLQNLMTETGWGQIPVVNPQSGDIIGIVTRTDLLKTLSDQYNHAGRQNLSQRLESALPPARLALIKAVAQAAYEERAALYIVGGFVRDLLLERASLDLDLVAEGDAIALAKRLQAQYGGRVTSHGRFGTAKWFLVSNRKKLAEDLQQFSSEPILPENLPEFIDLITARTEFYTHPTALPTVEKGSIKLDLHRRDFTINTLALRLDGNHYGELFDYWGGLGDLNQRLVRVLHSISFVDDPTRMLRAVRYEQRYQFKIEERTLQLLMEARSLLERVSGERIRHELDHVLDEKRRAPMLARLDELGLLSIIHPELTWDDWLAARFEQLEELPDWRINGLPRNYPLLRALAYSLWLIRLSSDSARAILNQLVYPRNIAEQILAAGEVWQALQGLQGLSPSQITAKLDPKPQLAILAAYLASEDPASRELLERYYQEWRDLEPTLSGHDLRAIGLPPGPEYQQILSRLRQAWLDGEVTNPDQEEELLESLLEKR
jgi:tRNA nucleotidyltransferase (CCA-adding enzyme)